MAVYTDISGEEFTELLTRYSIGNFRSAQGIAEGVENTNYLLLTDKNNYIATVFEKRVNADELPFFMGLKEHLAKKGIPCPRPVEDKQGNVIQDIKGRKAAIVTFLEGAWPRRITNAHCKELGKMLASMHLATQDFKLSRPNAMGQSAFKSLFELDKAKADNFLPGLKDDVTQALKRLEEEWPKKLPTGVIHADLFPDNVFFRDEKLTGVLDFYFACNDYYAYDLAICLNAWCFEERAEFNITKAKLLIDSYQQVRPLTAEEKAAFPVLARAAALRFLLSRLHAWLNPVEGAFVKVKDPKEYLLKYRFHSGVNNISEYGI